MLVVGVGLGGWIAAEIAVKNATRLSQLVMANAVGVKIGDRETRDIVDIWALMPDEFNALAYLDPKHGKRDYKSLPEAEVARRGAQPRGHCAARLVALHAQSQAQGPAAPHRHADAVPVGRGRPHPEREATAAAIAR